MADDIMEIAHAIVKDFNRELNRTIDGFTAAARDKLLAHEWPGNVRELRNVLERAMIFTKGRKIDVPEIVLMQTDAMDLMADGQNVFRFRSGGTLEDLEKDYLLHMLTRTDTSYAELARVLGISKKTLWDKRKRYNLDEIAEAKKS
jgi:DNA-binding NtrC family response regulator